MPATKSAADIIEEFSSLQSEFLNEVHTNSGGRDLQDIVRYDLAQASIPRGDAYHFWALISNSSRPIAGVEKVVREVERDQEKQFDAKAEPDGFSDYVRFFAKRDELVEEMSDRIKAVLEKEFSADNKDKVLAQFASLRKKMSVVDHDFCRTLSMRIEKQVTGKEVNSAVGKIKQIMQLPALSNKSLWGKKSDEVSGLVGEPHRKRR